MAYIDIALSDDDKEALAKAVTSVDREAITGLFKKIALLQSDVQVLSNPLVSKFQGEAIPVGGLIEHYDFDSLEQATGRNKDTLLNKIGLVKFDYDPSSLDLFVPKRVYSTSDLYDISCKVKIPASLYNTTILEAFNSRGAIDSYVASWMQNFNNKYFLYKFGYMEGLINKGASDANIYSVTPNNEAPIADDADVFSDAVKAHMRRLIFAISQYAYNFVELPSTAYNIAHHDKQTPSVGQLTLLISSRLNKAWNVALSDIYNYALVDVRNIPTVVLEDGVLPDGVEAMLVDNRFFRVHTAIDDILSQVDIDNRSTKFIRHYWAYYLYNKNFNAMVFKAVAPSTGK